jgi:hypothetical protein
VERRDNQTRKDEVMKTRVTKKDQIIALEAKLASLWVEYESADDDMKLSLIRLTNSVQNQIDEITLTIQK